MRDLSDMSADEHRKFYLGLPRWWRTLLRTLACIVALVLTLSAKADSVTPEEFKNLLRLQVSRLPEFQSLWRNTRPEHRIYLSGGILRGLIHHLKQNLDRPGGIQTMRNSQFQGIDSLLLQEWSDYDLVAPAGYEDWVKSQMTKPGTWDILSDSFMRNSINSGGATIEKVMVSPHEILDPYGAIDDYLGGRLVFKKMPDPNVGHIQGNTYLTQALRFVRFAENLPEAKPDPASVEIIRSIANLEWNTIRRGTASDYWIKKGVKKLYHSVGKSPARFIDDLKHYGLLSALGHHHFSLPSEEPLNGFQNFSEFVHQRWNWTTAELMDAAEVLGRTAQERMGNLSELYQIRIPDRDQIQARYNLVSHIGSKFESQTAAAVQAGNGVRININVGAPVAQNVGQQARFVGQDQNGNLIYEVDNGGQCIRFALGLRLGF
jgi:hypothetical protein